MDELEDRPGYRFRAEGHPGEALVSLDEWGTLWAAAPLEAEPLIEEIERERLEQGTPITYVLDAKEATALRLALEGVGDPLDPGLAALARLLGDRVA